MKEHDTDYQPLITCPHCGHKDKDSWECGLGDGDLGDSECGSCDKPFTIEARVVRTFTTRKSL